MDFRKKLNVRLYTAICILCVGIIMVISSFFGADDMVSSFGDRRGKDCSISENNERRGLASQT